MIVASLTTDPDGFEELSIGLFVLVEGKVVAATIDMNLGIVRILVGKFQQD
jgi:hypothetical protein